MPGPCQMLNYRIIRKFGIVKLYFEFMFKGEGDSNRIEHSSRYAAVHACLPTNYLFSPQSQAIL